jgi:hypothetical protein
MYAMLPQAIYTADTGTPSAILKIDKALMTITSTLILDTGILADKSDGENDVRTLVLNSEDEWLYASTRTQPGHVIKINRATMQRSTSLTVGNRPNIVV